jgi:hypothetical protein
MLKAMLEGNNKRAISPWYACLFFIVLLSVLTKILVDKHLSGDGTIVFFEVLEHRKFALLVWSRHFAEILIQWPLVIAVVSGITDIEFLVKVFGFGILSTYLVSFALTYKVVSRERRDLLLFPLASYLLLNMLADYHLAIEHHVLTLMTWPIVMLIIKERPLTWKEGIVLWILLAIYIRLYQTAPAAAAVMLLLSCYRIVLYKERTDRIISIVVVFLVLVVILVSVYFIVNPRDITNRGNFLDSLFTLKRNWEFLAVSGFSIVFFLGWLIDGKYKTVKLVLLSLSLLPIMAYVFGRITSDYAMTAYLSFSSRTLSGFVLPILVLSAFIVQRYSRLVTSYGRVVFTVVFVLMITVNSIDTMKWIAFKNEVQRLLENKTGYLPLENTKLLSDPYKDVKWSHNNTLLGLVWSYPCVNVILLNEDEGPQGPVNPRERLVLKKYLAFDKQFLQADDGISICNG